MSSNGQQLPPVQQPRLPLDHADDLDEDDLQELRNVGLHITGKPLECLAVTRMNSSPNKRKAREDALRPIAKGDDDHRDHHDDDQPISIGKKQRSKVGDSQSGQAD